MKYTRDEYIVKLNELKFNLKRANEAKHNFYFEFVRSEPYKKLEQKIAECETQIKEFQKEHYSDFGVYTNNERHLSGIIDGSIMRRDATLN